MLRALFFSYLYLWFVLRLVGADALIGPLLPPFDAPKETLFQTHSFLSPAEKEKNGFGLPRKERGLSAYRCPEFDSEKLRVYLKTPDAPGQRAFSRRAASFFLEIRQYSCEKMSCAAQKFLAAGHIGSFQIHPSCQLSVASVTTTRKVSALCASPFGGASSQNRAKAFPFGEGTERSEADEGRGAKTMHCAVGRVLQTLIRPFGPPSPRGRPSAARGKTPSVCAKRRKPPSW